MLLGLPFSAQPITVQPLCWAAYFAALRQLERYCLSFSCISFLASSPLYLEVIIAVETSTGISRNITKSGFGKSIRDTIYNCWELQLLAQKCKSSLFHCFQELSLYQARTFLIFMPKRYIVEKNEDYIFAMSILKANRRRINKGFYSLKDKLFIRLCLWNIKIAKIIVGEK